MNAFIYLFTGLLILGTFYGVFAYVVRAQTKGLQIVAGCVFFSFITLTFKFGLFFSLTFHVFLILINLVIIERTKKTNWVKPLIALMGFMGMLLAVINLISVYKKGPSIDDIDLEIEKVNQVKACGQIFGQYLNKHKFSSILILRNTKDVGGRFELFINGFRSSIDADRTTVLVENISHPDFERMEVKNNSQARKSSTVLEILTTIKNYPQCDLVVSFFYIPDPVFDYFWNTKEDENALPRPQFATINTQVRHMEQLINGKLILAVVKGNPEPKFYDSNQPVSGGLEEVFHRNYIIIDATNLKEIKRKFPNLFRS